MTNHGSRAARDHGTACDAPPRPRDGSPTRHPASRRRPNRRRDVCRAEARERTRGASPMLMIARPTWPRRTRQRQSRHRHHHCAFRRLILHPLHKTANYPSPSCHRPAPLQRPRRCACAHLPHAPLLLQQGSSALPSSGVALTQCPQRSGGRPSCATTRSTAASQAAASRPSCLSRSPLARRTTSSAGGPA